MTEAPLDTCYRADIFGYAFVVAGDGRSTPLDPRLDLRNHSPTGFAWGYAGSGPAQFALAILCHALGDDARALRLYQRFKAAAIQPFSQHDRFEMSAARVREIVEKIETQVGEPGDGRL